MPLFWVSLIFLLGIMLGKYLAWRLFVWLGLGAVGLIWMLWRRIRHLSGRPGQLPVWVLLLALALGGVRWQLSLPRLDAGVTAWYNDRDERLVLEGMVVADPDRRDQYTLLHVKVDRLHGQAEWNFHPVRGLVLVSVSAPGDWRYGDRLRLEGPLVTPPTLEEFSYREYLARQGIYSMMPWANITVLGHGQGNLLVGQIHVLRTRLSDTIQTLFPEPEASLLAGILLGVESGIPVEVEQAFQETGTSHIIAISGFNITIVSAMFTLLFGKLLGKRRGALAAGIGIAVYCLLAGANPPVVRAGIMGGLSLLAGLLGRRQNGPNSLTFVAALMALHDPQILWDVGFQLSFLATLGVILYTDPLLVSFQAWTRRWLAEGLIRRLSGPVSEYLLVTLAAQITTLPLQAYYFGRLSLVAFVVNPMVLPAQPLVMILGGLSALVGTISEQAGQVLAYLTWPWLSFTIRVIEWCARLPIQSISFGPLDLAWILLFYALLLAWTFSPGRLRQGVSRTAKPGLALAGLAAITVLVWRSALCAPDGNLYLTLLDTEGGEALLIQTSHGRNVLLGGSQSAVRLSEGLGRRLPVEFRQLDWVIVAAGAEDCLDGLPRTLERFEVQNALWVGPRTLNNSAADLQRALGKQGIPIHLLQNGQELDLGNGARLVISALGKRGAVFELEWGNFRALLPLGVDFEALEALEENRQGGKVSAWLLADGGYAPLNPSELIHQLNPDVILLSVDSGQGGHLPDPEVLAALADYTVLRTDQNGWIRLGTDSKHLWVETEK